MAKKKRAIRKFIYHGVIGVRKFLTRTKNINSVFGGNGIVYIITPLHCEYIAFILRENFRIIGITSIVINGVPKYGYSDFLHIVICPQVFHELPDRYIAFQLEQSINDRWFTPEYFDLLANAEYVFDYSSKNIEFLVGKGFLESKLHHLPIGYVAGFKENYLSLDKNIDVLFYGDPANPRREKFLKKLNEHFCVEIVMGIYGDEVHKKIASSKVVVNIHYYEDALLETTRIYESLSLGALVVSEKAADQDENIELFDLVDFVEISDVDAMIIRVKFWIDNENERIIRVCKNNNLLNLNGRFSDNFMRFFA